MGFNDEVNTTKPTRNTKMLSSKLLIIYFLTYFKNFVKNSFHYSQQLGKSQEQI